MKKIYFLLAYAFTATLLLTSCGGNDNKSQKLDITVVGADGTEYESYQECCSASDFVAAHRYIDKMEAQGHSTYEARDFVFREEALYLMSHGDDSAKKRIVYLLKQDDSSSHDSHCDMLVELAIDADDEAFVKTLTKHYNDRISSDMLRKIIEYLYIEKGDDSNLDFVTTLLNRYDQGGLLLDAAVEKGDEALVVSLARQYNGKMSFQSFKNVVDYLKSINSVNYKPIFNILIDKVPESKDMLTFALENDLTTMAKQLATKYASINNASFVTQLAAKNKREYSDIIIAMLQSYPVKGHPLAPGHYSYDRLHKYNNETLDKDNVEYDEGHYKYCAWLPKYNQLCDHLLDVAIANRNSYLAQKILPLFKKNIETVVAEENITRASDGEVVDNYSSYVRHYTADIDAAKKKYDDAVRSGAFK